MEAAPTLGLLPPALPGPFGSSGPVDVDLNEFMGNINEVKGRDVVIVDELIDTGGTLGTLPRKLRRAGAKASLGREHWSFPGPSDVLSRSTQDYPYSPPQRVVCCHQRLVGSRRRLSRLC